MNKIIFKIIHILLLFAFFISGEACCKTAENLNKILSDIQQKDSSVKDMQADFIQTVTYLSTDEQQISKGTIKHKKQNYIYIRQTIPHEQHIYVDGKKITTYVPANNQAIVEKWQDIVNNDIILTSVINFGKNWKSLKKENTIILKSSNDKEYIFLIKPKNEKQFWQMQITVDKKAMLITNASFNNGNFIINIKLTNYKLNNGLSNNIFKFTAPENTDIIEL